MKAFDYFKHEESRLEHMLQDLISKMGKIDRDEVLLQSSRISQGLTGHVQLEEQLLLGNLPGNAELDADYKQAAFDRENILDEVGRMTQVHIDEPDFVSVLDRLLAALKEHEEFSTRLFEDIQHYVSQEDLSKIDDTLERKVMRSTEFSESSEESGFGR
jgi:5'-3' exonuclease